MAPGVFDEGTEVENPLAVNNDSTPIDSLFGPGYSTPIRPTADAWLLDIASTVAQRGTCGRLRVGALVVFEDRILSTGYNGAPAGMPHCVHDDDEPCTVSVHAEANALIHAARHGVATDKATMYLTHQPCYSCAGLIINSGIRFVRFRNFYRSDEGTKRLGRARVNYRGGI